MRRLNKADWVAASIVLVIVSIAARFGRPYLYDYATGFTATGQLELGIKYRKEGRPLQEEEAYRRALSINPDFAPAHIALSALHLRRGEWADAIVHADNASIKLLSAVQVKFLISLSLKWTGCIGAADR